MAEPSYLTTARVSYDVVARDYAELAPARFAGDPVGRAIVAAFAEQVRAVGGPVADLGCGPGHVTAHLASLGVSAFGVDLSPRMVDIARRKYPDLRFDIGSFTNLHIGDGRLGGVLAWWSICHTPPEVLPSVFDQFHRTLATGGHMLVGFYVGDAHLRPERGYGHPVCYSTYLLRPEHVCDLLSRAGFAVTARLLTNGRKWPQACLLAHKAR
ncbi:MAG TPA: class I SAM-dependent methyltransferase [Pseudonocardiaceae bacterium]|nr:class I SAM-dependent methyltransferase [Pseudonocardiaceae bacterium]